MSDTEFNRKGRRRLSPAVEECDDLADTVELPTVREEIESIRARVIDVTKESVVSRHTFLDGVILNRVVRQNPKTGEFVDVYQKGAFDDFDPAIEQIAERVKVNIGIENVEYLIGHNIDLSKMYLPFSFFVKEPDFIEETYSRINLLEITENGFVIDDNKTLTLDDIDTMHANNKISDTEYGLLYYLFINSRVFDNSLHDDANEFGIRSHAKFKGQIANKFELSDNQLYRLMSRVYAVPFLYKYFQEKSSVIDGRRFINPFDKSNAVYKEFEDGFVSVSQIESQYHACHDVAYYDGGDTGYVMDGISSSEGVLVAVEIISRNMDPVTGIVDAAACEKEWEMMMAAGIGFKGAFDTFFATFAGFSIDRHTQKVLLRASADSAVIHLDRDFKLVQILGGEGSKYDLYREFPELDNGKLNRYVNDSGINSGIGFKGNFGRCMRISRADFKEGDILIVLTDGGSKVYGPALNEVNLMIGDLIPEDADYLHPDYLARVPDDRKVQSNIDQRHILHALGYNIFVRLIQQYKIDDPLFNFNDLKNLLRQHAITGFDDFAQIVKQLK